MTDERIADDPRHRSGAPAAPARTLPAVPPALEALLADASVEQIWVKRESEVWTVDRPDGRAYLKIMDDLGPFADELARIRWCADHSPIPTPELLGDALDEHGRGWFVASEVPGTPAHDPGLAAEPAALVRSIADGLRCIHATDPATCPFVIPVEAFIASAQVRVAGGGVDPTTMRSEAYQRQTAAELLDHLIATRPDEPAADQVVTHGDPTQPNLLLAGIPPELVGMVDLGRLAVTDRYRDVAIAHRSIDLNLGPEAAAKFLVAYGPDARDEGRLAWWTLADDLW